MRLFANMRGATGRALGRAGSVQRVHRAFSKLARGRTASRRGRFGTRDARRGFSGTFTNSCGEARDPCRGFVRQHARTAHAAITVAGVCVARRPKASPSFVCRPS